MQAQSSSEWIIALRQRLHAIPELGGTEHRTSATIKATLEELGIKYKWVAWLIALWFNHSLLRALLASEVSITTNLIC